MYWVTAAGIRALASSCKGTNKWFRK